MPIINELGMDVQNIYNVKYLQVILKRIKGMNVLSKCVMIIIFLDNVIVVVYLQR